MNKFLIQSTKTEKFALIPDQLGLQSGWTQDREQAFRFTKEEATMKLAVLNMLVPNGAKAVEMAE